MALLRCKHCGYEWEYRGRVYYATCPRCRYKVRTHIKWGELK